MICRDCRSKSLHKEAKQVKCFKCESIIMINSAFSNICKICSDMSNTCQYCGKEIKAANISEIIMHYNCQDKRFYIYKGRHYLYDTQNVIEALDKYADLCKELDKIVE